MRLSVLALSALCLSVVPAFAQDSGPGRINARYEACIRANASDAERSHASLSDAALFLTNYLCAPEIDARQKFEQNTALLASQRSMSNLDWNETATASSAAEVEASKKRMREIQAKTKTAYDRAHVDPDTGEIVMPADLEKDLPWTYTINIGGRLGEAPADLRRLAGRAVLEARQARLKAERVR